VSDPVELGRRVAWLLVGSQQLYGPAIPCAGYAPVGGDAIGQAVVDGIGDSPAMLLQNHGVFTVGRTREEAVKSDVMVEDAAKTVFYALQLGKPLDIPGDEVARARCRYRDEYGQW
jgi:L-ribulose-5-phosphate 4-epimerase